MFPSLIENLNTAEIKNGMKKYYPLKYIFFFFFCFFFTGHDGKLLCSKLIGTMVEKGNEKEVKFLFSFLQYFVFVMGVPRVLLTWSVTSEAINDCKMFFFLFISERGRRQPVKPFEQTFIAYVIVDSYNLS